MKAKPRIALVTGWTDPERRSLVEIALNILNTLKPFSRSLTWLATNLNGEAGINNGINLIKVQSKFIPRRESPFRIIPFMLVYQLKVAWATLKLLPKVEVFVFATGSDLSLLPLLLVKLARKKIILRSDGRPSLLVKKYFKNPGKVKLFLLHLIETLNYALVDRILPENRQLAIVYEMQKYDAKISIGSQYVDTSTFKEIKKLHERVYDVGYIGRLIREKGALEFARSLPLVLKDKPGKYIIIGDGYLQNEIEQVIIDNHLQDRVKSLNWVENRLLPYYLNDIKLVVVPSDYEGLSNLMLEAMACGTLVLATPVGGTPGIVREGETGFVLENSSPECIAKNVIRVLNHPNLDQIRENAHSQINQVYSYQASVERYYHIFKSLKIVIDNEPGEILTPETPGTPVTPGQRVM
jgi:glycosyltransferase involved in cell wall biosynthesis